MQKVMQEALLYAGLGWRVVPLKSNSKIPFLNQWQKAATDDEEVIADWFQRWPNSNVGIVFGEDSGVIDIECDDAEADKKFLEIFGGDPPPTPTFESARGRHRLFKWSAALPHPHKAVFKIGKLEFRTGNGEKGAQSVAPPSVVDGVPRRWLIHPSECELAEIPESVIARILAEEAGLVGGTGEYERKPDEYWQDAFAGADDGNRNQTAAEVIGKILSNQATLDKTLTWEWLKVWNQQNSPPLDEQELQRVFSSIYKRELERRQREDIARRAKLDDDPGEAGVGDGESGWRLIKVLTDPVTYKLESPVWPDRQLKGLTPEDLMNPRGIMLKAITQMDQYLADWFVSFWRGRKAKDGTWQSGIIETLINNMDIEEAPRELRRDCAVGEAIWYLVKDAPEAERMSVNGYPKKLEDGCVYVSLKALKSEMQNEVDPPTHTEVTSVLHAIGASGCVLTTKEKDRRRFMRLDHDSLLRLAELAVGEEQQDYQRVS